MTLTPVRQAHRPAFHVKHPLLLAALALVTLVLASACIGQDQPEGWAAPAVDGSTIYVATREGRIMRLDEGTATETQVTVPNNDNRVGPVYTDLILRNGVLYFGSYDRAFYAVNPTTGAGQRQALPAPVVGDALVLDDGTIVYATAAATGDASRNGRVYAFRGDPTQPLWQSSITVDEAWGGVALGPDGAVYVPSLDRQIFRTGLSNGDTLSVFSGPAAFSAGALIRDGVIYIGDFDRRFYAIRIGDAAPLWTFEGAQNWYWSRAAADGSRVYAGNLDGTVYALDRQTGQQAWATPVGGRVMGNPLLAEGRLIVPVENARVVALDPATGQVVWQTTLQEGARVRSNPVLANGKVYLTALQGGKVQVYVLGLDGQQTWSYTVQAN